MKSISIIVPVFNEAKYITQLIQSLHKQTYDHTCMEIIFIDGNSTDDTVNIIKNNMKNSDFSYMILNNTKRKTPISLNMGIKAATHEIIVRMDGHSEFDSNYIKHCVCYLENTDASNVGCGIETKSEGVLGNAIAEVLSSKFGVGNSGFRTAGNGGYVDTVPFGCFKKSLFQEIGYYNENLLRSEDNEFNSRLLEYGKKIYLFNDIKTIYHPRKTIASLCKMGYLNGKEIIQTGLNHKGSIRGRHLIPFFFFISHIIGISLIFLKIKPLVFIYYLELFVYCVLDILFSFFQPLSFNIKSFTKLMIYLFFHISYGCGSLVGLIQYCIRK